MTSLLFHRRLETRESTKGEKPITSASYRPFAALSDAHLPCDDALVGPGDILANNGYHGATALYESLSWNRVRVEAFLTVLDDVFPLHGSGVFILNRPGVLWRPPVRGQRPGAY